MKWSRYNAVLFDLDGVLTPTAQVHRHAWAEMFTDFLDTRADQGPYRSSDYFEYIDGKPRVDGVRDFLASRGITLPEGTADDPPTAETVNGLGTRKNDMLEAILERDGVHPYPGSLDLVEALSDRGIPMAVVSSSKNAPRVLEVAGLSEYFQIVVDGNVAQEKGLPGKPAPDTFEYAAKALAVIPGNAVVVEDAVSGVAAGAAGSFGFVLGVDRGVGAQALLDAGATEVVADLAEVVP